MKRRNAEGTKPRRLVKRNKITEGIYGSTFLYLKFVLVWVLVLLADFILEFRFEYLWPFWLLLRSVYDSFKYQGLAFSVFFVFIAITSDVVCYLLIPVQWLFFAASTYVWVQYVWHTDRGICIPTVSLWLLFVYIEASVRHFKSIPTQFQLDLCRPFAAHCIGYPVVTLGFGFKSYVSYKLRLRRQIVVRKENEFYTQLLTQALPVEQQTLEKQKAQEAWASNETEPDPSPGLRRSTLQMINDFLNSALPSKSSEDTISSTSHTQTPNGTGPTSNGSATPLPAAAAAASTSGTASTGSSSSSISASSASSQSNNTSSSSSSLSSSTSQTAPNLSSSATPFSVSQKHKGGQRGSSVSADRDGKDSGSATGSTLSGSVASAGSVSSSDRDLKKHNNIASAAAAVSQSISNRNSESGVTANGGGKVLESFEYIEQSLNKGLSVTNDSNDSSMSAGGGASHHNHHQNSGKGSSTYNGTSKANGSVNTKANNKLNSHKENPAAAAAAAVAAVAASASSSPVTSTNGPSNPTSASSVNSNSSSSSKKNKANNATMSYTNNKDEVLVRLETDIKRLKADLQASRNNEQECRSQINNMQIGDKAQKSELYQLRQDNENLQNKLHNLVTAKQQDKQNLAILERRLQEERKQKASLESQLVTEKKRTEESARAFAMAQASRMDCTETCKALRRDIENENKQARRELKLREDQLRQLERETETLRQYKDAQSESEVLMSALQAMQEKNSHLEKSLSAETRLKMDLFSALGDAKRQIEIQQGVLGQKEAEINEMKQKIAEVMAVMPSTTSFSSVTPDTNPHFSSTFTTACPSVLVNSTLNPHASDYTPKLTD